MFVWASLVAQLVKKPSAMRETWIRSLGLQDPLEKGRATHSSILENSMVCIVHGVAKSRTRLSDFHLDIIRLFIVHSSAGFVEYFQGRVTILRVFVPRQSLNGV